VAEEPEIRRADETIREERSASKVIIDGATAWGAAAGGTGTFLLGAAAAKKVFGGSGSGGSESSPSTEPGPQSKKED
jgi:hypothetical protein